MEEVNATPPSNFGRHILQPALHGIILPAARPQPIRSTMPPRFQRLRKSRLIRILPLHFWGEGWGESEFASSAALLYAILTVR